jgi:hypothetical protein
MNDISNTLLACAEAICLWPSQRLRLHVLLKTEQAHKYFDRLKTMKSSRGLNILEKDLSKIARRLHKFPLTDLKTIQHAFRGFRIDLNISLPQKSALVGNANVTIDLITAYRITGLLEALNNVLDCVIRHEKKKNSPNASQKTDGGDKDADFFISNLSAIVRPPSMGNIDKLPKPGGPTTRSEFPFIPPLSTMKVAKQLLIVKKMHKDKYFDPADIRQPFSFGAFLKTLKS